MACRGLGDVCFNFMIVFGMARIAGDFITGPKHLIYRTFSRDYLSNAFARTLSKYSNCLAVRCSLPGLVIERTQIPRYFLVSKGPGLQTLVAR